MTSPNINLYLYASVTLLSLEDGSSTKTFSFSNRPIIGNTSGTYLPLLGSVGDIATELDIYSVAPSTGSLRIIDSVGSFGADRKFSDFFRRYTPIGQDVSIYYKATTLSDTAPTSFTEIAKMRVAYWTREKSGAQSFITLALESRQMQRRDLLYTIKESDFEIATDGGAAENPGALGRAVPLIFGSAVQVKPILLSQRALPPVSNNAYYAYATSLNQTYVPGGIVGIFVEDDDGLTPEITSAATVSTVVHSFSAGTDAPASSVVTDVITFATTMDLNAHGYSYCVDRIDVRMDGMNNVGLVPVGSITLKVIKQTANDPTIAPGKVIGEATNQLSAYQSDFRGASDFWMPFYFRDTMVLNKDTDYYLAIGTDSTGDAINIMFGGDASYPVHWGTTAAQPWFTSTAGSPYPKLRFQLYGLEFEDVAIAQGDVDTNGLKTRYLAVYSPSATYGSAHALNITLEVDGIEDSSGGTITGTPNDPIIKPQHVLSLLAREWASAAWSLSDDFEFSTYSSEYSSIFTSGAMHYRTIRGAFYAQTTLESALRQVCRDSACRLTRINSGKHTLYPWGREHTEAGTYGQDDFEVLGVRAAGTANVINNVVVRYDPALLYTDPQTQLTQGYNDYQGLLQMYTGADVLSTELVDESEDLFGRRYLADDGFPLIGDATSAATMGYYLLARYNTPDILVILSFPLANVSTLKLLDVIQITTPELPSYYASWPVQLPAHYDGYQIPAGEYDMPVAETYRAQIESRRIRVDDNKGPQVILTCRLLLNYPKDPT